MPFLNIQLDIFNKCHKLWPSPVWFNYRPPGSM